MAVKVLMVDVDGVILVHPDAKGWSVHLERDLGFSYDTLINGTIEETASPFLVTPFNAAQGAPKLNTTHIAGVFPSQKVANTANTTSTAALAAWHFMQIWIHEYATSKFPLPFRTRCGTMANPAQVPQIQTAGQQVQYLV